MCLPGYSKSHLYVVLSTSACVAEVSTWLLHLLTSCGEVENPVFTIGLQSTSDRRLVDERVSVYCALLYSMDIWDYCPS